MISACTITKELPPWWQKTVQLAMHPNVGDVVIKRWTIKSFTSLERIRREVELLSELDSDYYPRQFHFNVDIKTKQFEIVEQYIAGWTLRESMDKFRTPEAIFQLMSHLIEGLSIIWDKGIVHRDLKPENIIIREDGKPCIIDLGIARFLDQESLTNTLAPMWPCTPVYAAPEQLANLKNSIDVRTDFFALGIIALELFLGVHPFDWKIMGNEYSIPENILRGMYFVETTSVKKQEAITGFSDKTLQMQPYNRFRNHGKMSEFITKQL